ncbi:MFS transporter [Paraburkholderia kururiensis]|uniref:MFS transporter n=1 Tax=Paraburkholderia kururiensis TaxID=984307 RepID=UPI0018F3E022|nr:MFS transporter [Paraburkholderia kururiensis]
MQVKTPRLGRIQRIAVTFLMLAGIVNYLDRSTLSIANHSVSGELGLSASQMGLLLSAFSFAYAFSQLPVGALLDRFGARLMLGLGMLVWSVAQLCGGLVQTLQQFLVARIALGIGEAPQFPAGAKVVSEWFALRERGRPTGIFTTSSTIGPALAPPILTGLLLAFGWRWMFVVMGVLGIAVALGWYIVYRNRGDVTLAEEEVVHLTEDEPHARAERRMTFAEWRGLFGSPTTWGMIFGFMGVIYMVWLYLTWLPAYLEHERHLSIAKTGWVVSIPYLFGTLGMLSSGYVADGLMARGMAPIRSRKWPICTGLICAAVFTVPAAFTPNTTLAIVYLSLAMYFVNMASGGAWALVSVTAPRHLAASLGSIQNFGGYFGGSFAPFITGIVVDRTHSFVNAFLISAAVSFAAALVYMFVVRAPIAERSSGEAAVELA